MHIDKAPAKKKILFFSNTIVKENELKGSGNWIITLISELKHYSDFHILIAYHDKNAKVIKYKENNNTHFIQIPLPYRHNFIMKLLSNWLIFDKHKNALSYYKEIISKYDPDIIQIFGLESPFIRVINHTNKPIIIHLQGLLAPYIYKYYPHYSNIEIIRANGFIKFLKGINPFFEKKEINRHLKIEASIYKNIKYVMGRTDWDRRCLKAIAPQAQYYYCQEIMRQPFYNIVWAPLKNKEKIILYTTIKDTFYKNVDIIFETCIILETNCNLDFEWRIAGVSSEDVSPQIMKNRKKVIRNIKLLGNLSADSIINNMLNANIFIFPSGIENSPNALEEAMLIGMPIITTYAGGITSIIEDYKTGVIVNEGDPYSLAGAIIEVIENYENFVGLGMNARNVALSRHNSSNVVKNLMEIFKSVLLNEQKN